MLVVMDTISGAAVACLQPCGHENGLSLLLAGLLLAFLLFPTKVYCFLPSDRRCVAHAHAREQMDQDTLAAFGKEVGVDEGPASFDALRSTIVTKLEEREGTWSEIAPEVVALATKFAAPA